MILYVLFILIIGATESCATFSKYKNGIGSNDYRNFQFFVTATTYRYSCNVPMSVSIKISNNERLKEIRFLNSAIAKINAKCFDLNNNRFISEDNKKDEAQELNDNLEDYKAKRQQLEGSLSVEKFLNFLKSNDYRNCSQGNPVGSFFSPICSVFMGDLPGGEFDSGLIYKDLTPAQLEKAKKEFGKRVFGNEEGLTQECLNFFHELF